MMVIEKADAKGEGINALMIKKIKRISIDLPQRGKQYSTDFNLVDAGERRCVEDRRI
jgi:hypothetical protein